LSELKHLQEALQNLKDAREANDMYQKLLRAAFSEICAISHDTKDKTQHRELSKRMKESAIIYLVNLINISDEDATNKALSIIENELVGSKSLLVQ
jgi:hypothetical protein